MYDTIIDIASWICEIRIISGEGVCFSGRVGCQRTSTSGGGSHRWRCNLHGIFEGIGEIVCAGRVLLLARASLRGGDGSDEVVASRCAGSLVLVGGAGYIVLFAPLVRREQIGYEARHRSKGKVVGHEECNREEGFDAAKKGVYVVW